MEPSLQQQIKFVQLVIRSFSPDLGQAREQWIRHQVATEKVDLIGHLDELVQLYYHTCHTMEEAKRTWWELKKELRDQKKKGNSELDLAFTNWISSFFFLPSASPSLTSSNTTAVSSHSSSSVLLPPSKSPILQKTSSSSSSSSSLTTEENIDQEEPLDQNNLKDQEISQLRRRKLVK